MSNNIIRRILLLTCLLLAKILFLRTLIFSSNAILPAGIFEFFSLFVLIGIILILFPSRLFLIIQFSNILLSIFLLCTDMYFNHFGRMFDYHAIFQASVLLDIRSSIFDLLSFHHLVYFSDIILLALAARLRKHKCSIQYHLHPRYKRRLAALVLFCCCISIVRIYTYPTKQNMVALAQNTGILNAQFYQISSPISKDLKDNQIPTSQVDKAILELKQIKPVKWPKYFGVAKDLNLILVQMESTEGFVVGLSVNNQQITPNLNKLMRESLYFPNFYSQIGQGNTSDSEFVSNTSIYPLKTGSISTEYIGVKFPSLPRLLKIEGYTSLTFHPNKLKFWRRDNLYPCLGFDHAFDKEFYQDEDIVGPWGSSDEVLFKKGLPILSQYHDKHQLFYASFITLSNHHPYNLPENKKKLILPPQLEGTFMGRYLSSVHYQDYALGLFIDDLKAQGIWDKSLFVAFGDHFGISKAVEKDNQNILSVLLGRNRDDIDRLNIPLFIRVPGLKPQVIPNIGGQIDLLPTLANLLGITYSKETIFGQDILNYPDNLIGFRFYYPDGTFISPTIFSLAGKDEGLLLKDHSTVGDYELFKFNKEEQRIRSLLQLSDQYLLSLKP